MQLLLVRHGQTPSNVLGLLDSAVPGPSLTSLGRAQAAALPVALQERRVSSITVSNLIRTSETAQPLAASRGLSLRIDAGVREISAGDVEMRGDAEALEIYTRAAWGWSRGDLELRVPGSENGFEFLARFDDAIDRVMAREEELPVVVSHGGSIRSWVGITAQNTSSTFAADSPLHNTGAALLERDRLGNWELLEWYADPLGGPAVAGPSGPDPTGDPAGEVTTQKP